MAAIPRNLGKGGAFLSPGHGDPSLLEIVDGIADDLAAIAAATNGANITSATPAAITADDPSAALAAFTDPPSAAEMALLRALVNELRTLSIDVKARFAEYRTLVVEVKADLTAAGTLITSTTPAAITAADPSGALGAFTDPPAGAEMIALQTLVNELRDLGIDFKARFAEYRTIITEIKTDVSAASVGALVTTKAAS